MFKCWTGEIEANSIDNEIKAWQLIQETAEFALAQYPTTL